MNVYENQVIGDFLYGLGAAVQARSHSKINYSAVNLLQQTPADKMLADVLLEFEGTIRLIEFKRSGNKSKKECHKHKLVTVVLGDDEHMIQISKSIHWFIETTIKEQALNARIVPYLEAFSERISQYTLEEFIETTAEHAVSGEASFSRDDVKKYFSRITPCQGPLKTDTGGLLMAIDSKGKVTFVVLQDMLELRLHHRELSNERNMQQSIQIQKVKEHDIDRSLSHDIGYER